MNIVSLFAGCGGLDLGFEKAGFNVVWANEFDETISATYRFNHPNTVLDSSDIRALIGKDIPDCDGIIGGPPCQAWSEGGKRLGIEDPRGKLFWDYIRIVKDKQPKFFIIENVQGILDDKHKESLEGFIKALDNAGYNITYELLNAADYKIPQDRFRVFFVGIRKDLANKFLFPDKLNTDTEQITLKQAIGDIAEIPRFYVDEVVEGEHPLRMNHDVYNGSYDAKYMSRNRVRGWDETSFTIQAQARNAPIHPQAPKMLYVSSTQRAFVKGSEHLYRRLSVRECARIQTFPDSFRFLYKDVKNGYKMVGNAVPPRLAWCLAIQMKKAFGDLNNISKEEKRQVVQTVKKVSIASIAEQYPKYIVNHQSLGDVVFELDFEKRVLIGLVKPENVGCYLDGSARIYYTGKNFPATVELDKLYYFMPYIKGSGVRDLYLIKTVRVGTKQEVCSGNSDNSLRLIFEIQYVKHLFCEYQPIHLNIWHTFTDIKLETLQKMHEGGE